MSLNPGDSIGPYKLVEKIGEGSASIVYTAAQEIPIRRRVAVKVLKTDSDLQTLARFEAERQALALMDHPNIVRILDCGTLANTTTHLPYGNLPYSVMEFISGMPITEYCDRNRLSIPQRLGLFEQLCQAVQHAHQKGIIHRNISPPEVLVTTGGPPPMVKLIDFGIGKASGLRITEKTLVFTGPWPILGRPVYISPEQADAIDVDLRTDIYSLGAVLYELLTHTTPFDPDRFRGATDDEIRRILAEEVPPRPSSRCAEIPPALDAIVMKCLEKDRNRRFQSVDELGNAIQEELSLGGLRQLGRRLMGMLRW